MRHDHEWRVALGKPLARSQESVDRGAVTRLVRDRLDWGLTLRVNPRTPGQQVCRLQAFPLDEEEVPWVAVAMNEDHEPLTVRRGARYLHTLAVECLLQRAEQHFVAVARIKGFEPGFPILIHDSEKCPAIETEYRPADRATLSAQAVLESTAVEVVLAKTLAHATLVGGQEDRSVIGRNAMQPCLHRRLALGRDFSPLRGNIFPPLV